MADHGVVGGEDERSTALATGSFRCPGRLGEVQGDLLESTEAARRLRELTLPVTAAWRAWGFLPEVREDIAEEVVRFLGIGDGSADSSDAPRWQGT